MNAHPRRTPSRRRYAAALVIALAASLVAVSGLSYSRAQGPANVGGRVRSGTQIPPKFSNPSGEDIKKEFNDDDLKVKGQKPRGEWGVALETDMNQFYDTSAPVAIGTVQSLSGGGKYAGVVKIKRVEIKNRSSKAVNSVQFRWEIVGLDNPAKVLLEDTIPFANVWVEAGSAQVVEIPTLYPALLFKPLAKDGVLYGRFQITFGIQEARFADGSLWRRRETVAYLNVLYFPPPPDGGFPPLASLAPGMVPPTAGSRGDRVKDSPCGARPRSTASAFSFAPVRMTGASRSATARRGPSRRPASSATASSRRLSSTARGGATTRTTSLDGRGTCSCSRRRDREAPRRGSLTARGAAPYHRPSNSGAAARP